MTKCIKYILSLTLAVFLSAGTAFAGHHNHDDCNEAGSLDEWNTDNNCGTSASECEWTFELVCPAEVQCDGDVDLGTFCVGETIVPSTDDWITFFIGGEVGRNFSVNIDVDECAIDDDGNSNSNIQVKKLEWQRSVANSRGGLRWLNFGNLSNKLDSYYAGSILRLNPDGYCPNVCVSAEESDFGLRVRPKQITTDNANGGSYSVRISLGVDFGYSM